MPTARDGKHFANNIQMRKYEDSLPRSLSERGADDFANAPSGDPVKEGARHGIVMESHYKFLGGGQHKISVTHADGHSWEQIHPEAFRAHQMLTRAHGFDEQPPAIKTHMRSRAQPTGEKEEDRLRNEDHREQEENYEEEE